MKIALVMILFSVSSTVLAQQPRCAISVEVHTPAGAAANDVTVYLLDRGGTPVAQTSSINGKAQFCDVERGWFYAVRVGDGHLSGIPDDCRSTVVENIRISESRPEVKITMEAAPCEGVRGFGSTYWPCTARLYVRDGESAIPLRSAVVTNLSGKERVRKTDLYFELYFERDPSRKILVRAEGYEPAVRTISCEHRTDRREIPIRLYRTERP